MTSPAIDIRTELRPGDLGRIVALHGVAYAQLADFGSEFEALVAVDLGEFVRRADPDSRLWIAAAGDGEVLGSIAIDRAADPLHAHLRWFVLAPASRGAGLGRRLLDAAVAFCDESGVEETVLWTFQGLDAARHLYEQHGFALVHEQRGDRWATPVVEQKFRRRVIPTRSSPAASR